MRAVVIREPGGPEVLELREVDAPTPARGEILVRVQAFGLNRADLLQRRGSYQTPAGVARDIPGLEYAGVVEACGPGARRFRPGDAVMGITAGAAYAEYVVVHEREALAVPAGWSAIEAAAIPEAFLTAYDALFVQLGLTAGETVLIHAVAGGVGLAALQLAKLAGARVLGTSRTPAKLERAAELGLDAGIVAGADWPQAVLREASQGVDVVLDLVGGAYLAGNLEVLRERGRLIVVGLTAGARAELDLGRVLRKRLTLVGTVLRSRPLEEKVQLARTFEQRLAGALASRALRPVVELVLPAERVAEAHARMEANATVGKTVLTWGATAG